MNSESTLISALNFILYTNDLQQIDSSTDLSSLTSGYESVAYDLLTRRIREVQAKGLYCNTFRNVTLTSNELDDIDGTVLDIITSTTDLHITVLTDTSDSDKLKLYDKYENEWLQNVANYRFTVIKLLPWTDLPEIIRMFITYDTALAFMKYMNKSAEPDAIFKREYDSIVQQMKTLETQRGKYSLFNNPNYVSNVLRLRNPNAYLDGYYRR